MARLTTKQVKSEIEKLVDKIDAYLYELESNNKDNTQKYEELLFIAGGLRELMEVEFN